MSNLLVIIANLSNEMAVVFTIDPSKVISSYNGIVEYLKTQVKPFWPFDNFKEEDIESISISQADGKPRLV